MTMNGEGRGWARLWSDVHAGAPAHAISPGALGEYAVLLEGQGAVVAGQAFPAVAAHLATGCASCAADLDDLLTFAAAERPAPAPVAWGTATGLDGRWRVVLARLLPQPGVLPAGLRGARRTPGERSRPESATATYQTEDDTIVLSVVREARPGSYSVTGLVTPRRAESSSLWGAAVRVLPLPLPQAPPTPDAPPAVGAEATPGIAAERIDDRGNFVLDAVAPGRYQLEIRPDGIGLVVLLDGLQIGPPVAPPPARPG